MARRLVKADHRSAAIVMSRGPAYVPPTPGSFPHRTSGGPVVARDATATSEHIGQIMDALKDAGRAQGQNFTKLMDSMQQQMMQQQQQMRVMQQQMQQQMRVMQQQHRDEMDAIQAQVIDARRMADAAAADVTAMYPRLNSVLEDSASAFDKALLEMSAHMQVQSRAQSEQLREAVISLRAESETALDTVRAGADAAAALGAGPGGLGAGGGRLPTRTHHALGPKRPFSSATPTPRVPKSPGPDDDDEYDGVRVGDSRLPGMTLPPTGSNVLIFLVVDCMAQGGRLDTEACVYLGESWSSMLPLRPGQASARGPPDPAITVIGT